MRDSEENRTLMIRYILGQVSSEERAGLEERYIGDSDLFEELMATENDLIDAYARDKLSGPERFQFESRFLATPELRERVRAARSLAGYGSSLSSKSPRLGKLMTGRNAMSPALRFAFSAMMVVVLIWASWMTISNLRLRRQIEQTNAERAALQQQQQQAQRQIADLSARIQQFQTNNQTPEIGQPAGQPIVSLMLVPGLQRGNGKLNLLPISSDLSGALLLLRTRPDPLSSYSVFLETPEGKQVLKRDGLKALPTADGKVVRLSLPAHALGRGDYVVRLFGIDTNGRTVEVDDYSLRVVLH